MKIAGLKCTLSAVVAVMALSFSALAVAQTYPSRPVKIIVPFGAGGPADNFARFMGQRLGDIDKWAKVIKTARIKAD